MLKKILLVLAIVISGTVIWLAIIDGTYHIKRTIQINVPTSEAYAFIEDFHNWSEWSPWLIMENDVKLNYEGNVGQLNHGYSWEGQLVGSGEMQTTQLLQNELIEQNLRFKEPFPSQSQVYWTFINKGTKTELTWGMKGSMPFFFKFMAKQMEPLIGMDYERGLNMLKERLETGKVSSKLNIEGLVSGEQFEYIGISGELEYDDMKDFMSASFKKLTEAISSTPELSLAGSPLTIYHDFGLDGGPIKLTAALPVKGESTPLDGITRGVIPEGNVLKIQHLGRYENIGNAWATAYSYARYNKLKQRKEADAFEIYTTDPSSEPDTDKWETIVFLPVK